MLEDLVERANDTRLVPPVGGTDGLGAHTANRAAPALNFDDRPEPTSWKRLFEFGGNGVVRVEIRVESGKEDTAISIPLALCGNMPSGRNETVDIVDISVKGS